MTEKFREEKGMAYKVWFQLCFPQGEEDTVPDVRRFVAARDDLEIEGVNRFGRTVTDYPYPEDGGGLGQPRRTIIPDGHGVEVVFLAPDQKNGPALLLALMRDLGRAFPDARISGAMRDISDEYDEHDEDELEFTSEELTLEMQAGRNPTQ
ncbi:hypothetical protein [Alloalcanivorax gelatiniphagus]|uniref:Uncharacterized protein n=2 Tax=Alloalcanivorax gelatiniphagus TaxID=1194167 RepID=A0ABY2XNM4_9GAMM|nr:hypothetical protein [Alloalcanivorax gelatiniphagus]TMW13644.1 hypothetical protein FGS76_05800 [Alloalcanivorax gelatiniphagus]